MPLYGTCKKCGHETENYSCYRCIIRDLRRENESLLNIAKIGNDFINRQSARGMNWPLDLKSALDTLTPELKAKVENK